MGDLRQKCPFRASGMTSAQGWQTGFICMPHALSCPRSAGEESSEALNSYLVSTPYLVLGCTPCRNHGIGYSPAPGYAYSQGCKKSGGGWVAGPRAVEWTEGQVTERMQATWEHRALLC